MLAIINPLAVLLVITTLSTASGNQDIEQQLLAADRAFAKAVTERRLDGWMDFMTDDAARMEKLGGKFIKGKDAIRKADGGLFADPKRRLVWDPVDAHAFADQISGITSGRYQLLRTADDGKETVIATGSYFTGWRKLPDGNWKVAFDTGAPDAPAK
ncbi:MAG TPA: DUF4440 domain-containing protein [Gemmatales bacterium]|nr:DUF4440 domain-containing protein [Gemmatales bacterium]